MATNYAVNYDDERFQKVESEKDIALEESKNVYDNMIDQTDQFYKDQIDASKEWTDKQQQIQQENTDFAIEKVEQQRAEAEKNYKKEQSGAYVDYQRESNKYGVNAEQQAAAGLTGGGYSESSQVSIYNTYQNRVATARESYNRATLNYDNAIKEAQLQNNAKLAEIAYQALQKELELSLSGFQYKNTLIAEQLNRKQELENVYYNRWQDVLSQINTENSLAEQIRQYNEQTQLEREKMAEQQRQYNETLALQKKQLEEEQRQYNESLKLQREKANQSRSSGSSGSGSKVSKGNSSTINKGDESTDTIRMIAAKTVAGGLTGLLNPFFRRGK